RAAVVVPGDDRGRGADPGHHDRRRGAWIAGAAAVRPAARRVPELPVGVIAPALDVPARHQRTGVGAAGGERGGLLEPAHRNRPRRARVAVAVLRSAARPIPELPVVIGAPAVDPPAR